MSPRYSLRLLLAVTAIVAILIGVRGNRARHQKVAVKKITASGGYVLYDWHGGHDVYRSEGHLAGYAIENESPPETVPMWIKQTVGEDWFQYVTYVQLDGKAVDDAMISTLKTLPRLERLWVKQATESDAVRIRSVLPDVRVYTEIVAR